MLLVALFTGLFGSILAQSICPPGTTSIYNSNSQIAVCSPQDSCSCDQYVAGSICQYSSQYGNYICCGVQASQCGQNSAAQISNGNLVYCSTGSSNTCASGFTCQQGVCCAQSSDRCSNTNNPNCFSGQVYVNGTCVTQNPIGSFCFDNSQCGGNAVCQSSTCTCPMGTTNSNGQCINSGSCPLGTTNINNNCITLVRPGYSCQYSQQCIDGSQCTGGVCTCTGNMQLVGGSYCLPYNGGPCQSTQIMVNGVCTSYSMIGGSCQSDQQCVGQSYCTNSICQCRQGTQSFAGYCISSSNGNGNCGTNQIYYNGQCYNYVQIGGYCQISQQCQGGSTCMNNYCYCQNGQSNGQCIGSTQCQSNQIYYNGQCYNYVQIGGYCQISQQCQGGSTCMNNYCYCQNGQSSNGQCNGSSQCQSNQVYVNGQCYNYVQIGGYCQVSQQCQGGSTCMNNYCYCQNGQSNGQCIGSTQCQTNQVYYNGQCYNYAQIGGYCQISQQCQGGSTCMNNYCYCQNGQSSNGQCNGPSQCQSNQVLYNGQCYNTVQIGGYCQISQQCLGGSTCTSNYCRCQSGQSSGGVCTGTGGGTTCQLNQTPLNGMCYNNVNIGGSCQVTQQCQGGSSCIANICQCQSGRASNGKCPNSCSNGQVYVNGQCFYTVNIGGSCQNSQQCLGQSQCPNGFCQCPSGTTQQNGQCVSGGSNGCNSYQVYVNGACLDMVSIGQSCTNVAQCNKYPNSICSSTCQCPSGYGFNGTACATGISNCGTGSVFTGGRCLALVALGQFCQDSAQCMGFGYCSGSVCQCSSGLSNYNGICRSNTANGCGANQVLVGSTCYNTATPGQQCVVAQQCTGGSVCQNSVCQCVSPQVNYGNGVCTNPGSNGNLCSAGETPIYQNNQLINCLINACPTNSFCEYNDTTQIFLCCQKGNSSTIAGGICNTTYYKFSNNSPYVCSSDSSCYGSGYNYCRQMPGGAYNVCCST